MQVRKFEATSLELALKMVKKEMGPNALILSTEQKKTKWYQQSLVEITAAFEQKEEPKPKKEANNEEGRPELDLKEIFVHRKQRTDAVAQPTKRTRYIDIDELPRTKASPKPTKSARSPYLDDLVRLGFSEESAKEIQGRVHFEYPKDELERKDFLAKAQTKVIVENLKAFSMAEFVDGQSWAAVGISGAGKTTSIVKIALYLKGIQKGAVLTSLDDRKVTGRNELAYYSRLIRTPFSPDGKSPRMGKVELVDLPAMSFGSDDQNREIEKLQGSRHSFLVMDATQRLSEMLRIFDLSLRFHPKCVVFTRLDIVSANGTLYDFLKTTRLPVLGFSLSHSFKVPFKTLEPSEMGQFLLTRRGTK